MIDHKEYIEAMEFIGFVYNNKNTYSSCGIECTYKGNCLTIKQGNTCYATTDVANAIMYIESAMQVGKFTMPVMAAINTRNLAQNLVRVRSSNVWAIGFNVKNKGDKEGDLLIQFKNKNGGAGELYIYYSVSIKAYRRLLNAPSVGHEVWTSIRNNYSYSHLTGNKRGVLPNAINNW